jgi:hypothetical protein
MSQRKKRGRRIGEHMTFYNFAHFEVEKLRETTREVGVTSKLTSTWMDDCPTVFQLLPSYHTFINQMVDVVNFWCSQSVAQIRRCCPGVELQSYHL